MDEVTATEIFTFVNNLFSDESGSEYLREIITIMMDASDSDEPKDIVRKFSMIIEYYQRFCLERIADQMSKERHRAVSQLHDASVVVQGGE